MLAESGDRAWVAVQTGELANGLATGGPPSRLAVLLPRLALLLQLRVALLHLPDLLELLLLVVGELAGSFFRLELRDAGLASSPPLALVSCLLELPELLLLVVGELAGGCLLLELGDPPAVRSGLVRPPLLAIRPCLLVLARGRE